MVLDGERQAEIDELRGAVASTRRATVPALEELLYLLLYFDIAPSVVHRFARTYDHATRRVYGGPRLREPARKPGKLRIGYLSADLRDHVMGKMMWEPVHRHDRGLSERRPQGRLGRMPCIGWTVRPCGKLFWNRRFLPAGRAVAFVGGVSRCGRAVRCGRALHGIGRVVSGGRLLGELDGVPRERGHLRRGRELYWRHRRVPARRGGAE